MRWDWVDQTDLMPQGRQRCRVHTCSAAYVEDPRWLGESGPDELLGPVELQAALRTTDGQSFRLGELSGVVGLDAFIDLVLPRLRVRARSQRCSRLVRSHEGLLSLLGAPQASAVPNHGAVISAGQKESELGLE